MLQKALRISEGPGGPAEYRDTIRDEILQVEQLMEGAAAQGESFYEQLPSLSFKSLKRAGKDTDKYLKEKAQRWRGEGKKLLEKLRNALQIWNNTGRTWNTSIPTWSIFVVWY